jgi:hypothetical protein
VEHGVTAHPQKAGQDAEAWEGAPEGLPEPRLRFLKRFNVVMKSLPT